MPALLEPAEPTRLTVERYFALLDEGVLDPHDRVELLRYALRRGVIQATEL